MYSRPTKRLSCRLIGHHLILPCLQRSRGRDLYKQGTIIHVTYAICQESVLGAIVLSVDLHVVVAVSLELSWRF